MATSHNFMAKNLRYFPRILLISVIFILGNAFAFGQVECDIVIDSDIPVCPGGTYTLSVPFCENCTYAWTENDGEIEGEENELTVVIESETLFGITVLDTITLEDCMSDLVVTVHPGFKIEFIQRQLTCTNGDDPNGNTAKVQALGIGDQDVKDYIYEWEVPPIQIAPGDPSLAIGLKAHQYYTIKVTDNNQCSKSEKYWTKSFPNPLIEILADPDTAYLQNPYITFAYENLTPDTSVSNHFWYFVDDSETSDLDMPKHMYQEEGPFITELTVYNNQGCDTFYTIEVLIKPVDLFIPNVITPNSDGTNDTFIISENNQSGGGGEDGRKSVSAFEYESYDVLNLYYERSELHIFNRWGRIVYTSNDYQNDWDGGKLPDGVYFYVLKCFGAKSDDVFKGSVSIYGSGR